jgi:hypothetical protein
MAATNPQTLITEARCFACYGVSSAQLIKIALLRRSVLASNPEADVSPEGLIHHAACFFCYIPDGNYGVLIELALLDLLSQSLDQSV